MVNGVEILRSEVCVQIPILSLIFCLKIFEWCFLICEMDDKNRLGIRRSLEGQLQKTGRKASTQNATRCLQWAPRLTPWDPDPQPSKLAKLIHLCLSLLNLKISRPSSEVPFEKCLASNADITSRFSVSLYLQSLL